MAKQKTQLKAKKRDVKSAFIVTLPLFSSPKNDRLMADRFLVAERLFNVLMQHGLQVVRALKRHPDWQGARLLPKTDPKNQAYRKELFERAKHAVSFTQTGFEKVLNVHAKAAGFAQRIGSAERQTLAKRVFTALEDWVYGTKGKPRFRGAKNPLCSMEDKSIKGPLHVEFDANGIPTGLWLSKQRKQFVPVKDLSAKLKHDPWLAEALQSPTKYCRLTRRTIKGTPRYYVQLVLDGQPPVKPKYREAFEKAPAKAGLDLGLKDIAIVNATNAALIPTRTGRAEALDQQADRLQRAIERKRRKNNPQMYAEAFKNKSGKRCQGQIKTKQQRKGLQWIHSKNMKAELNQLAEIRRMAAEERKQTVQRNANHLISFGKTIKHDGVSPKALQRVWGKSVLRTCPGLLISELDRKLKRLGGKTEKVNVQQLKTSQYDHTTNDFQKKKLSERIHTFRDGSGWIQRDIYSAVLHLHAEGITHHPQMIENHLREIDSLLSRAGWWQQDTKTNIDGEGNLPIDAAVGTAVESCPTDNIIPSKMSESSSKYRRRPSCLGTPVLQGGEDVRSCLRSRQHCRFHAGGVGSYCLADDTDGTLHRSRKNIKTTSVD